MALIKCPECGKNNVSSSAESCPDCGYPIKNYVLSQEIHDKTNQTPSAKSTTKIENNLVVKKENAQTIKCENCGALYPDDMTQCPTCGSSFDITDYLEGRNTYHNKKQYKTNSNAITSNSKNIIKPQKPQFSKGLIIYSVIATLLFILLFHSKPFAVLLEIFTFVLAPLGIYGSSFLKEKQNYDLAERDIEEYHKKMIKESQEEAAMREAKRIRELNAPKCPHCNSSNIERITTMDRGVSIAMVGLASGKIGKQYKCKNCKHMW